MNQLLAQVPEGVHRIFAYGSLMWRPDFEYISVGRATVKGFHRRLCVISHHYRGTQDAPGVVLGLDEGGSCGGLVYEIAPSAWHQTIDKVRQREMLRDVYREGVLDFSLENGAMVKAVTYIVRHQSQQFLPEMPDEKLLPLIMGGKGTMGTSREYVVNTIKHLREYGIHDENLERFAPHVI